MADDSTNDAATFAQASPAVRALFGALVELLAVGGRSSRRAEQAAAVRGGHR